MEKELGNLPPKYVSVIVPDQVISYNLRKAKKGEKNIPNQAVDAIQPIAMENELGNLPPKYVSVIVPDLVISY